MLTGNKNYIFVEHQMLWALVCMHTLTRTHTRTHLIQMLKISPSKSAFPYFKELHDSIY